MTPPGDKVAIVSGAGAGSGRAVALRFSTAGYRVLAVELEQAQLADTCQLINDGGGSCIGVSGDIARERTSIEACDRAVRQWERIDAVVANAGVQTGGDLLETGSGDWSRIFDVNLHGAAHLCKAALPVMIERGAGTIVLVSSINALGGAAGMAAYDASKAAVLGLMRSLAIAHGRHGVRVNAICPGNTLTDYHVNRMAEQGIGIDELRRMTRGYGLLDRAAEPPEIANAIYFLASEDASFITGHSLVADGGYSITPH